jgi:uncharacterized protein
VQLKIRDIPPEGLAIDLPLGRSLIEEALAPLGASPGDLDRSNAHARLHATKEGETVFLRGALAGAAQVPCARCLAEVRLTLDAPMKMIFTPAPDRDDDEGDEASDDEEDLAADVEQASYHGIEIDLEPVVREALLLAVPMAPLCAPSCKGLCPRCGADWNKVSCGCAAEPAIDPRLAPLKGLKL